MKIKLKLTFIIYLLSWQGIHPFNKRFLLKTEKNY